jgi:hypothetical protein
MVDEALLEINGKVNQDGHQQNEKQAKANRKNREMKEKKKKRGHEPAQTLESSPSASLGPFCLLSQYITEPRDSFSLSSLIISSPVSSSSSFSSSSFPSSGPPP